MVVCVILNRTPRKLLVEIDVGGYTSTKNETVLFRFGCGMPRDFLQGCKDYYDVVVIGSGLAGMTVAKILGRAGHSVLLLEQHYKLGGLATWFRRPGSHIFDISLHGFSAGTPKSCKR